MSSEHFFIYELSFLVGILGPIGLFYGARRGYDALRRARGDARIRRRSAGVIYCPRCKNILTGIFPKWVFHEASFACPHAGRPHFHATCDLCGLESTIKP